MKLHSVASFTEHKPWQLWHWRFNWILISRFIEHLEHLF